MSSGDWDGLGDGQGGQKGRDVPARAPEWLEAARRNRELAETSSRHQQNAQQVVDGAVIDIEAVRSKLASVYAAAGAQSIVEHAVGESLTQVRKCLEKLRKAASELAQQPLPLH